MINRKNLDAVEAIRLYKIHLTDIAYTLTSGRNETLIRFFREVDGSYIFIGYGYIRKKWNPSQDDIFSAICRFMTENNKKEAVNGKDN